VAEEAIVLFEEYAARFARGEHPDLREYLQRAGEGRDELAALVDGWLQAAPPPEPSEEQVALMQAWLEGQPPLVELRARRGLRRSDVVRALIERFRLDPAKEEKVDRYLHQVETGSLVPAEQRLLDALADILRVRAHELLTMRPRPLPAQATYYRADPAAAAAPPAAARSASVPAEADEIDELFRARNA
jgi:hypothetical protein